ncbi:MAG: hypothetical protein R2834_01620 [Rhodothermales bacterium]
MKKTKHEPTPAATRSGLDRETNGHADAADSEPAQEAASTDVRGEATRWVQENQTLALVGAFGVGVFLGVLLRK